MTKIPNAIDQDLLFQVLGTVALLLLAFVEVALGQFPFFFGSTPLLMLMVVVVIVLYVPIAAPPVAVVLAGVLFDLLQGAPPGFTASQLVLAVMLTTARRPLLVNADAGSIWYEFALLLMVVQAYGFVVITLWAGGIPAPGVFVFQYAVTILLFPIVHWVSMLLAHFARTERTS